MESVQSVGVMTTTTSTALLAGLRDPGNHTVWLQYVERYRPMMVQYARRLGLGDHDAEDAAQTSLLEFSEAYRSGKYRRSKGRLRSWLFGIVSRQVLNHRRRCRLREVQVRDPDEERRTFEAVESPDTLEALWEEEWQNAIFRQCLIEVRRRVKATTFEAFEQFALQQQPAEVVARRLGLTSNAVFGAKRRVLKLIQEMQPLVEQIW